MLVLVSSLLLTACDHLNLMASDPNNECDHPVKPTEKPYTDEAAGLFILAQSEVIDKCRARLGHEVQVTSQ